MAKGKKKTRGLRADPCMPAYKEPTPAERVDLVAKHLVLESIESHPGMMTLVRCGRTSPPPTTSPDG